jgi:hypothetical protein
VKIRKDATLKIKYHKYGESLEKGVIGKSNVEARPGFRGNIWLKKKKIIIIIYFPRSVCKTNVQD